MFELLEKYEAKEKAAGKGMARKYHRARDQHRDMIADWKPEHEKLWYQPRNVDFNEADFNQSSAPDFTARPRPVEPPLYLSHGFRLVLPTKTQHEVPSLSM